MELEKLFDGVECEIIQKESDDDISSIVIDSRKVTDGSLYVCIRGLTVDGHKFIPEAAGRGAAAVMTDRDQEIYPPGVTVIKTPHTRKSLCRVASNFYGDPAGRLRLTGITGTNGKTSTANYLETILSAAGRKTGLIGTTGVRLDGVPVDIPYDTPTTPDTIDLMKILAALLALGAEDVVMEVSSHALALYKVDGIRFHTGVFTNLTHDHLDLHGTMENYRAAKAKLFPLCRYGVVNADDEASRFFINEQKCLFLTYGIHCDCDLKADKVEIMENGASFEADIDGVTEHFFLPAKGRFNIYNCLAAIEAALTLGVPVETIRKGVADIKGVPGRIQLIPNDKKAHILVDYAHSPDGLINVINAVREFTEGRVITLFGCGGDRDKAKRPVMGRIAGELSDYCIITSDNPRSEPPELIIKEIEAGMAETSCKYEVHQNRREAIFRGIEMLSEGDALIIAGKGHENYQIIGSETFPFDDAEVVKEKVKEALS
jgi:UDP-N-acetylmuramoyl-L-alanyl-D-glutamate--2,6-diaminopimelate ligase